MERIHVVGAGGIGCAIAYALDAGGMPVTIVERSPVKLAAALREGVRVDQRPARMIPFAAFDEWKPESHATILLCTKCYDNAEVLSRLPATVTLVPIQNGFDPALERLGHVLEGIASFVSECPADRPHTRITRAGALHLGPRRPTEEPNLLSKLVEAFRRAGLFRVVEVAAIEPFKYTKLMYNAAISPLAAAAGIDNGKLLSNATARRLFFDFIQENYRILSAAGIPLGKIGPLKPATVVAILKRRWIARLFAFAFEPSLRGTYCSMAPDLPRGRTEIDFYNQRLVDLAGDQPCPLNRVAVTIIKRMERERLEPRQAMLYEFAKAFAARG